MKAHYSHKISLLPIIVMAAVVFSGCGLSRQPVPLAKISDGHLAGFSNIRFWDVEYKPDVNIGRNDSSDCSVLALSGGGANGAFGAGFLNGWTVSGARPKFRIVTGISTGSLIAPLAFLGPEYDEVLKKCYTTISTKDILDVGGLLGVGLMPALFGESYASTKPLQKMIAQMIDEKVLAAVAVEHAKGRRLYMGTTNLDAERLIIWDMGAIAGSGNAEALKLFRKVMLASASIPGAFPPVRFDVEVDGRKYDEMHVDGGVITEVFGYGRLFAEQTDASGEKGLCSIYVIRNGKLDTEPMQVPRRTMKIAQRSFSVLMTAHSWSDILRMYFVAQRDKVDFNYVSLPHGYESHEKEMFDPVEMKRLFDLGFDMAKGGYKWNKTPPLVNDSNEVKWIWTP